MKSNAFIEIPVPKDDYLQRASKDLIVRKVDEWKYNYLQCIGFKKNLELNDFPVSQS